MVRDLQPALVLMDDPRASLQWRDLGAVQAWRGIHGPASQPGRISALWEQNFKCFNQQLHPGILLDREQRNNFRAGSDDDRNNGGSGWVHGRLADDFSVRSYFCLPTVISIWRTLVSRSLSLSLESFLSS